MSSLLVAVILLFVVYKLVDWLLRLPAVGRHADRCVLITGCSSGFGRDLARRLDSRGCHVFATCRKEQDAVELSNVCSSRLRTLIMDVTQPESVRKAFQTVKDELEKDGKVLWAVVNNAAVCGLVGPPDWMVANDYRDVADVNLYGLIDVTMTFLPLIKKSRGRVVNTTSVGGRCLTPTLTPYCVTKFGVEAFSDGLRRSLKLYGCKVSIIEPTGFQTNIISPDHLRSQIECAWGRLSPETKHEFGQDYFDYNIDTWSKRPTCERISDVTDAYEHAILGLFPRARYLVGPGARIAVFVQSLPEWLGDWIIGNFLGAAHKMNAVLPAILRKRKKIP